MSGTGASPGLWTTTGRRDTTAMSYLLARAGAEAVGHECDGEGWPPDAEAAADRCPEVLSAPRGPEELVPGSPSALRACAQVWRSSTDIGLPSEADRAAAAGAYDDLATAIETLKRRAVAVYADAVELGVGEVLLCDGAAVRARMKEHPESANRITRTVRAAVDARLRWIEAHQSFNDAIAPLGAALGLPWPEPAPFGGP